VNKPLLLLLLQPPHPTLSSIAHLSPEERTKPLQTPTPPPKSRTRPGISAALARGHDVHASRMRPTSSGRSPKKAHPPPSRWWVAMLNASANSGGSRRKRPMRGGQEGGRQGVRGEDVEEDERCTKVGRTRQASSPRPSLPSPPRPNENMRPPAEPKFVETSHTNFMGNLSYHRRPGHASASTRAYILYTSNQHPMP